MKSLYLPLIILTFLASLPTSLLASKPSIPPESVAILYNSNVPDSKELAEYYAEQRNIPKDNLIGFPLSPNPKISRKNYQTTLEQPLREHFTKKNWWTLQKNQEGITIATRNKIQVLVTTFGVPYGINPLPKPKADPKKPIPIDKNDPISGINSASVDSELSVLSIHGFPTHRILGNKYFKKDTSFSQARSPFYMLVGRIDANNITECKRMIDDAIEVEKHGLWGMTYLDLARKEGAYKMGDDWILDIEKKSWELGLPTTIDKNKDTYLTNYPMRDAAVYFGWYTTNCNGPLLNPKFRFKKGAVAVHLHSFSASNLRNPKSRWVGPIINAGAAATVGNVYEPYLERTHHFNILHNRLTKGYTLIEAAYMSIPVLSWQNVVIGDPLYQPFKQLEKKNSPIKEDRLYIAVKTGFDAWKNDPDLLARKFRTASQKSKNGRYYEVIGLYKLYLKEPIEAALFFNSAEKVYTFDSDKTRMKLHTIDIHRSLGNKAQAVLIAKELLPEIKGTSEEQTIKSIINILSPPPPAPPKPAKKPLNK